MKPRFFKLQDYFNGQNLSEDEKKVMALEEQLNRELSSRDVDFDDVFKIMAQADREWKKLLDTPKMKAGRSISNKYWRVLQENLERIRKQNA
jgi:hypothetical protein